MLTVNISTEAFASMPIACWYAQGSANCQDTPVAYAVWASRFGRITGHDTIEGYPCDHHLAYRLRLGELAWEPCRPDTSSGWPWTRH